MSYFRECPRCGCNLDPGEQCDCIEKEEKLRKRKAEINRLAEREGMWVQQELELMV